MKQKGLMKTAYYTINLAFLFIYLLIMLEIVPVMYRLIMATFNLIIETLGQSCNPTFILISCVLFIWLNYIFIMLATRFYIIGLRVSKRILLGKPKKKLEE